MVRERNEISTKDICSSVIPTFEPGRKVDGPRVGASFEQLPKEIASKSDEPPITGIGKLRPDEPQQEQC